MAPTRIATEAVLAFIDAVEACDDPEVLTERYLIFAASLGFTSVVMGRLRNPGAASPLSGAIIDAWPREWRDRWIDKNYIIHDPIARYSLIARRPFTWQEAYEKANAFGQRILDESRDFNFTSGIAIPVSSFGSVPGIITLGGQYFDLSPSDISRLELVSLHVYSRLEELLELPEDEPPPRITPREAEILHFMAAGKTNSEIAEILCVSEFMVRDYISNFLAKTGCLNRAHAVSYCLRHAIILP